MIDRDDFIKEQLLRENIRKAINIVKKKNLKEDKYIRTIVRSFLKEALDAPRYEYNSLNQLGHLMTRVFGSQSPKKQKGKFAFKEAFIDLVSSEEDRQIFVEFILDFSEETMDNIDAGEDLENVKKGRSSIENDAEEDIDLEDSEEDEVVTIKVSDIPGGDMGADSGETEEEDFTLGEDSQELTQDEENAELKKYTEKAYESGGIATALIEFYTNFPDNIIKDEVVLDTRENIFLPESEKQYKVFPANSLTERDLFKIFYKVNVLSWAGRYNNDYFNDNPITQVSVASPGDIDIDSDIEGEFPDEELGL